jgi:sugar O-acyltransferase (sialic acid O-acetyltransferase NeuD family)
MNDRETSQVLEPMFLYGAGGHGRSVAEVIRRQGRHRIVCVLDDVRRGRIEGVGDVAGGREQLESLSSSGVRAGFVAIGNNGDRESIAALLESGGFTQVTAIDPAAIVAMNVAIGPGTVMMPFTLAAAGSSVGRGVILNTSATVDHDSVVGDFAHLSVGVHLGGDCHVGARTFVGIGAVFGNGVRVGTRVTIGAGAAVLTDIPDAVFAAGIPARPLSASI